jgi:hypothetical protein
MGRPSRTGRHDIARVPEPLAGFPPLASSGQNTRASIAIVAVSDQFDPQRRVRALARIDLLDQERRSGKIDEASYLVGREVELVFEQMNRIGGGGQWWEGDRVDAASAAALNAMVGAERAFKVNAFLAWLVRHLGRQDTRLLWIVLGNRLSLRTAAASFGRPGVRGRRYTVDRFRDALACLAEVKAARGRALR